MVSTIVCCFENSVIKITAGLYYTVFFKKNPRLRGSYFVLLVCLWRCSFFVTFFLCTGWYTHSGCAMSSMHLSKNMIIKKFPFPLCTTVVILAVMWLLVILAPLRALDWSYFHIVHCERESILRIIILYTF